MKPTPGSPDAVKNGCTCPVLDNNHGEGLGNNMFYVNAECVFHTNWVDT